MGNFLAPVLEFVKDFSYTLFVEVCANSFILFSLICLAILVSRLRRQRLAQFFGINQSVDSVKVFVSRIQAREYGTIGTRNVPTGKGFRHVAITELEYKGALSIQKMFASRLLALLPKTAQQWVNQQVFNLSFVEIPIDASPEHHDGLAIDGNLVLIGSSAYNALTHYYLQNTHSPFYFDLDDQEERILRNRKEKNMVIPGKELNRELGIIQRIRHEREERTVIICAGTGTAATYNCVHYLATYWKQLQRDFGNGSFAVCLAFNDLSRDSKELVPLHRIEIIRTEPSIGTFDSR
jgi:hypothetical protein